MKRRFNCLYGIFFIINMLMPVLIKAQRPVQISVSNHTLLATDSLQPFWFTANQHDKYHNAGSFTNLTDLYLGKEHTAKADSGFSFSWGINGIALFSKNNYFSLNRMFAGIAFKGWELKAGMFYDPVLYAGLSSTNGNLARNGNTRPVPTIRFSTLGYKKLPFWQSWFSFKGEYDEGLLNDERYVEAAHLHHKSLYGKFRLNKTSSFTLGFEHYVMWGGTSPVYGELPGWEDYFRYVFALPGNEDFPETDQLNSSGNQLGTYQFEFEKQFDNWSIAAYLSHPFEDNSGLIWRNWPDNLIGIHFSKTEKKGLITDVVAEFTNVRQQSIKDSIYSFDEATGKWRMNEYDNYYNHGVYRSGFTYEGLPMSSPLFYPVNFEDGISVGLQSNRYYSFHTGIKGYLTEFMSWKGLLTFVQHLGTYSAPYSAPRNNFSGLLELNYLNPAFPVELGISAALDVARNNGKNAGIQLKVAKSW